MLQIATKNFGLGAKVMVFSDSGPSYRFFIDFVLNNRRAKFFQQLNSRDPFLILYGK